MKNSRLLVLNVLLCFLPAVSMSQQPPPNDNIANAIVLEGECGVTFGTSTAATAEAGEPSHDGQRPAYRSVWWKWVAPDAGEAQFSVSGSYFTTILAVYRDNGGADPFARLVLEGRAQAIRGEYTVSFLARKNTTYWIAVDGLFGDSGNIKLSWVFPIPPRNDFFNERTQLPRWSFGSAFGHIYGAEPRETLPQFDTVGGYSVRYQVWWSWQAPVSGSVTFDTIGSQFDTVLAIWSGSNQSSLTLLGADDDSGGGGASRLTVNVIQGQEVHIMVGRYGSYEGGVSVSTSIIKLSWSLVSPCNYSLTPSERVIPAEGGTNFPLTLQSTNNPADQCTWLVETDVPWITFYPSGGGGNGTVYYSVAANVGAFRSGHVVVAGIPHLVLQNGAFAENDNFTSRTILTGMKGSIVTSNVGASAEPNEPYHAYCFPLHSVWWEWTAPGDGIVKFSTCGSYFQTILAVYITDVNVAQPTFASLQPYCFNIFSPTCANGSEVIFVVQAGRRYYLAVDSYGDAGGIIKLSWKLEQIGITPLSRVIPPSGGSFSLDVDASPEMSWSASPSHNWITVNGAQQVGSQKIYYSVTPATSSDRRLGYVSAGGSKHLVYGDGLGERPWNDRIAEAIPITGYKGTVAGHNQTATKEPSEPNHAENTGGKSVWWAWFAPTSGTVQLKTEGSSFDTLLAVYRLSGSQFVPVAANDDANEENRQSFVSFVADAETTYLVAVDGKNGAEGEIYLSWEYREVYAKVSVITAPAEGSDIWQQWQSIGLSAGSLVHRDYDDVTKAPRAWVFADPTRYRVSGFLAQQQHWLPYRDVGPSNYVRGKFYIYASSHEVDWQTTGAMPNLRLRLAHRYAQNAMLEVFNHLNADPQATQVAADIAPSTVENKPSLYRVDLDPIDTPFLMDSGTTEGIWAGFEAYAVDPQDEGYVCLSEVELGVYPKSLLSDAVAPVAVYAPDSGGAGNLSWSYSEAVLSSWKRLAVGSEGEIPPLDPDSNVPGPTYSEGNFGVRLSSVGVPADRLAYIGREFGVARYEDRVRVEPNKIYTVRFHVTSSVPAASQSQMRCRARTVRYMWSQKFEVGGAYNAGPESNIDAQQALPGTGCQNPDRMIGEKNGGWYTVIMHSPLTNDIRPEFAPLTPLSTRMPRLSAQPGPGVRSPSLRDLRVGFDLFDTLSGGALRHLEQGEFTVDRIEIRAYDAIPD